MPYMHARDRTGRRMGHTDERGPAPLQRRRRRQTSANASTPTPKPTSIPAETPRNRLAMTTARCAAHPVLTRARTARCPTISSSWVPGLREGRVGTQCRLSTVHPRPNARHVDRGKTDEDVPVKHPSASATRPDSALRRRDRGRATRRSSTAGSRHPTLRSAPNVAPRRRPIPSAAPRPAGVSLKRRPRR